MEKFKVSKFCNLPINVYSGEHFLDWGDQFKHYCTLNAQIIRLANEDKRLHNILQSTFNSIDGTWPYWIFRMLYRKSFVEKVSGSDYLSEIIEKCIKLEKRIFFLGGHETANQNLVNKVNSRKGVAHSFSNPFENYPFSSATQSSIKEHIETFAPHVLIVSYGAPKQEFWIFDNSNWLRNIGVVAAYGLGGSVDMLNKPILKSPKLVSKIGLESLWRISVDPFNINRWKRLLYSLKFFKYIFKRNF